MKCFLAKGPSWFSPSDWNQGKSFDLKLFDFFNAKSKQIADKRSYQDKTNVSCVFTINWRGLSNNNNFLEKIWSTVMMQKVINAWQTKFKFSSSTLTLMQDRRSMLTLAFALLLGSAHSLNKPRSQRLFSNPFGIFGHDQCVGRLDGYNATGYCSNEMECLLK